MEKNMEKYNSYTLAFDRINKALEAEFPLEAIAIEESIITDRLMSFALAKGIKIDNDGFLGYLIKEIKKIGSDEDKKFMIMIDAWRKQRNEKLHAIVKSKPGTAPVVQAEDFISEAMELARQGKDLARESSNWHRKQMKLSQSE